MTDEDRKSRFGSWIKVILGTGVAGVTGMVGGSLYTTLKTLDAEAKLDQAVVDIAVNSARDGERWEYQKQINQTQIEVNRNILREIRLLRQGK